MATEFNYVARLDTTQIMSGLAEIRSQVGMAFGSPTAFQAPAMGISGGGGFGSGFGGAVTQNFQQMFAGLQSPPDFGGTHTNPAMAYSPHYGMIQAETSLDQEWRVHRGGFAVAQSMKPPGVSAGAFMMGVEQNFIARQLEASDAASTAAGQAFWSGAGGLVGGEVASLAAAPVGAAVGGRLASRFFGAGAAGAGRLVGGLGAGLLAFEKASEYIGNKINEDFAQVEQIRGVTTELGELAGGGRNLNRVQRYDLGIAARQAAKDIGMDVNQMGDVLALGRQAGMLPTATDPGKAREQFRDFARSIEEGAQVLGSSLATATAVIKQATSQGMGAREGVIRAAGAGGAEAWLMQQQQPSWINQAYSAMAGGPLGTMQTMAAMGGTSLAGMGMMDLPGAALSGLTAGGGDMMSNAARFMVHQDQYLKGMGAGGRSTLARQQLEMGGELISSFMPDLSANDAKAFFAMNAMGLSGADARKLVAGGSGGGGMSNEAKGQAIAAMQESQLGPIAPGETYKRRSFGSGYALEGALTGATFGPKGAVIGGVGGFVAGNLGALADLGGEISDAMPSWLRSAITPGGLNTGGYADRKQQKLNQEYETRVQAAKNRAGYMDVDVGSYQRFMSADLRSTRLDITGAGSSQIVGQHAGMMMAMGLDPVAAGAGTIKMGDQYFSAMGVQQLAKGNLWSAEVTDAHRESTMMLAHDVAFGAAKDTTKIAVLGQSQLEADMTNFRMNYETVRLGQTPQTDEFKVGGEYVSIGSRNAGENLLGSARRLISAASDKGEIGKVRARLLQKLQQPGGMLDPEVRAGLEQITGKPLESLQGAFMAGRAGAAGANAAVVKTMTDESRYLLGAYGSRQTGLPGVEDSDAFGRRVGAMMAREDWVGTAKATQEHAQAVSNVVEMGRGSVAEAKYFKQMGENSYYLAAKDAVLAGRDDEAKKLLHQAKVSVQMQMVKSGEDARYLDMPDIDPTAKVMRPGAEKEAADYGKGMAVTSALLGMVDPKLAQGVSNMAKIEQQKILEKTSWKDQVKAEAATVASLKAKRARRGPGTMQRAIGFGQQESAMSQIQRSLAATEQGMRNAARALEVIEKRIAGAQANPQATGTGTGGVK